MQDLRSMPESLPAEERGAVERALSGSAGLLNAAHALSPLSDPESRIAPERAPEDARPVLYPAVAESRAGVGAGGKSFVVQPLYDEAPTESDWGCC
jgi:hypothetical protein